ncbi:unnamed protein product [Effrenium voratum]|nr:unnamed protein product [Effrenium voratum]
MAWLPRLIVVLLWVLCWRPAFVGHGAARNPRRECVVRRVRERRRPTGRPRQGQGSFDGHTHPKVITKKIMQAPSASEVLGVVKQERNNPKLDFIALSAAWFQLAKMQFSRSFADTLKDPFLDEFIRLTGDSAKRAGAEARRNARATSSIIRDVAKLDTSMHSGLESLKNSLAQAAKQAATHMDEQGTSNVIWAAAKLSESAIANVIWATAKLSESGDESLLTVLATLAVRTKEVSFDMKEQEVANVIWATAKLSLSGDKSLLAVLPTLAVRTKEVEL